MNITRPLTLSPRKQSKPILNRTSSHVARLCSPIIMQTPIKLNKSTHSIHSIKSLSPNKAETNKYKSISPIPFPVPYHNHYSAENASFLSSSIEPTSDRYIANRSANRTLADRFNTISPETITNNGYRKALKTELFFDAQAKSEFSSTHNGTNHKYDYYNINNNDNYEFNFNYYHETDINKNKKYYEYNKGASPISDKDKLYETPSSSPQNETTTKQSKENNKKIDCFHSPKRCLTFCCNNNNNNNNNDENNEYNPMMRTTPIRMDTQFEIFNLQNNKTMKSNQKFELNSDAYCVLDAPRVIDDFYSSILDWNEYNNFIGVSLQDSLHIHDPNNRVSCDLIQTTTNQKYFGNTYNPYCNPTLTAVKFDPFGNYISVGTDCGVVSIWDIVKKKCIKYMQHDKDEFLNYHIGVLEWSKHWNNSCIIYGSKLSENICISDLRESNYKATKTIVTPTKCVSLKWSPDENKFAIGGRDRCISIYDIRYLQSRIFKLKYHTSSIRAIAWSPHNYNILISGGGSLDKKICVWNLNSVNQFKHLYNYIDGQCITINKPIKCIRSKSQVCNIIWNPFKSNQILSTHGFDTNDINLWDLDNNKTIKTLTGHSQRVLYVALSSNKKDIVTASNDETIRFWNVFQNNNNQKNQDLNPFQLFSNIR